MDREVAENIMAELKNISSHLNELAILIERISDEEEKKEMRKRFGISFLRGSTELQLIIAKEYPDLDPDIPPNVS